MFVCLRWWYHHILSSIIYVYIIYTRTRTHTGLCFPYWCAVDGMCKWSDTLWPVGRVRLFANYTSLSSLCRFIGRHCTIKMLVRYVLPSVWLRFSQFFRLSFIYYMGLCVFSLPNSPAMIVRMYFILISSNRKYESLIIVKGYVMKQWFALYVLLCS